MNEVVASIPTKKSETVDDAFVSNECIENKAFRRGLSVTDLGKKSPGIPGILYQPSCDIVYIARGGSR